MVRSLFIYLSSYFNFDVMFIYNRAGGIGTRHAFVRPTFTRGWHLPRGRRHRPGLVFGWVRSSPNIVTIILMICSHNLLSPEDIEHLDVVRDVFLGPPEEMTSTEPTPDPDNPGRLIGGTAFERCGQNPVKGSGRCYSLTMTHQRQRALVGPTAANKRYEIEDDESESLNLEIRGNITRVNSITTLF